MAEPLEERVFLPGRLPTRKAADEVDEPSNGDGFRNALATAHKELVIGFWAWVFLKKLNRSLDEFIRSVETKAAYVLLQRSVRAKGCGHAHDSGVFIQIGNHIGFRRPEDDGPAIAREGPGEFLAGWFFGD